MKYPPFCDIIRIEVSDLEEKETEKVINSIYENLLKYNDTEMHVFAPMPSPINKIKNRYRWRIIIKCKIGNNVIRKINRVINNIKTNVRISVDINPNNMN
ncbi:MAG: hypothetical protein HFJ54_05870 [Clostridia bacterium]|nr:hypothetical protein [Clostridia bacterium]